MRIQIHWYMFRLFRWSLQFLQCHHGSRAGRFVSIVEDLPGCKVMGFWSAAEVPIVPTGSSLETGGTASGQGRVLIELNGLFLLQSVGNLWSRSKEFAAFCVQYVWLNMTDIELTASLEISFPLPTWPTPTSTSNNSNSKKKKKKKKENKKDRNRNKNKHKHSHNHNDNKRERQREREQPRPRPPQQRQRQTSTRRQRRQWQQQQQRLQLQLWLRYCLHQTDTGWNKHE